MRENYKGFTLVELLAIIVILAIIALITTPVILNVIENSRLNAAKDKAWGTIDAVRIAYATAQTSEQEVGLPYTIKYPKTSASDSSTDSSTGGGTGNGYINNTEVKASGENPTEGTVTISNNGTITANSLKFGNYYCSTINGKNGKLDPNKVYCSRMSDDVVSEKAVMMSRNTSKAFWQSAYNSKISTVDVLTNKDVPTDAVESWDVSAKQDKSVMAWIINDSGNSGMYKLYIGGDGGVSAPSNMMALFYNFSNTTIMNLSNLDTSNVTNMNYIFEGCNSLTELNASGWDLSNTTDCSIFNHLQKLTTVDVSNWNIGKTTDINHMFAYLKKLRTVNMENFKSSNVTNMSYMFDGCINLTNINVSNFDTSKVTNMSFMFQGCTSLTKLNLSSFDTSKVTDMSYMFASCTNLTNIDVSNFNTSNVINMNYMFAFSKFTELDLCSFDTSKVTNMNMMFGVMTNLKKVNVGTKWTTTSVDTSSMFSGSGISEVTIGQC